MYRSHIGPQHAPHKAASTADIDGGVVVCMVVASVVDDDDVVWHFISIGTKHDGNYILKKNICTFLVENIKKHYYIEFTIRLIWLVNFILILPHTYLYEDYI